MEVDNTFIPTAGAVGLLPMVTYFFFWVAIYALLGNFIFSLGAQASAPADQRNSRLLTAIVAIVAGSSYFLIQDYYRHVLAEVAAVSDPADRQTLLREAFNAINQFRYMDWSVTTPLLLLHMVSKLPVRFSTIRRQLTILLAADFFMILTGYIGEQQLSFDNEILVGPKLIWGAVSTIGYAVIPYTLLQLWKTYGSQAQPEEQWAFRLMALTTVTFWGVYPIGYILSAFSVDPSLLHISFTIADLINKVGLGIIAYIAGTKAIERQPVKTA
ncbi:bacteriorhodopsin [Spirosoma sp. KUDC1026]|uniref:bacteriorhodopsin n=1 Tax=Spirosoma sp. KUDC1026 TaxID=2745947 RepID=UPI00159B9CBF|nr:bacteriorhodopsin [Spirosoma sp. KUDC1026]QKZ12758.1 bacteriorhodopsin [Spirosoma sp. KUDC1026]